METISKIYSNNSDIELISSVKRLVDQLYERQQIFGLSLETLELTRRFNMLLASEKNLEETEPFIFNKLVSLTRHLERNLVQELQS